MPYDPCNFTDRVEDFYFRHMAPGLSHRVALAELLNELEAQTPAAPQPSTWLPMETVPTDRTQNFIVGWLNEYGTVMTETAYNDVTRALSIRGQSSGLGIEVERGFLGWLPLPALPEPKLEDGYYWVKSSGTTLLRYRCKGAWFNHADFVTCVSDREAASYVPIERIGMPGVE